MKMKSVKIILILALAAFSFVVYQAGRQAAEISGGGKTGIEPDAAPFENIALEAKAAYVFDLAEREPIFAFNPSAQLPLASLTKIMTAIVVKENFPEWLKISIPLEAVKQEGDSGFLVGERWKISDLADVMLISSSNDAAFAFAASLEKGNLPAFIALMNKKARELGLAQTYFLNPTGLDFSAAVAGAFGSAKNAAELMAYGLKNYPSMFEITGYGGLKVGSRRFKNTNKLVNKIPGIVAGKTGFSDLAGGNLVVVADLGLERPVAIVVLGSSEKGRFKDVKTLYEETLKYFSGPKSQIR